MERKGDNPRAVLYVKERNGKNENTKVRRRKSIDDSVFS